MSNNHKSVILAVIEKQWQKVGEERDRGLSLSRLVVTVFSIFILSSTLSMPVLASHNPQWPDDLLVLLDTKDLQKLVDTAEKYQHGQGVTKDLDVAIGLLCTAARKGFSAAQYELGWLYLNNRRGTSDQRFASAWLNLAAENGDQHAKNLLRFTVESDSKKDRRCPLSDGYEFLPPIKSKPKPTRKEIELWVARLAPHYRLPPQLVIEVIRQESNFNAKARSPKNAQGLMQLIPATAKRFSVTNVWDPIQNLQGGMAYLRWLLDHFKGDIKLALAGYNAGEKAVAAHGGIPPYLETRHYVKTITKKLKKARSQKL